MIGALSLAIVLFAAPDADASRKLLRVAYASQYEWKEDKVANATFDFAWKLAGESRKKVKWTSEASGSVVIVDGEIKRVHIPGPGRVHRDRVRIDLAWVLRRFVRKPFDERFKDAKFAPPEKMADGNTRVTVNGLRYLVADNRITGMEVNVGSPQKPSFVRVIFEPKDLGGGYGILAESRSHSFGGIKTEREQKLTIATQDGIPIPRAMRISELNRAGKVVRTLKFSNPRLNLDHPIAVDAVARDRVKAAWERRYAWPGGLRFEGKWERELDNATTKGRWARNVKGEFQFLGGELELTMDESVRLQRRWRGGVLKTSTDDLNASFMHLAPTLFDAAFPGCGFEVDAEAADGVVRVLGHPTILCPTAGCVSIA